MLKKRIIACLIIKNNIVVQSIGFNRYLPVGKPEIAVDFLNQWGIDEIVLLDIDAAREGRCIDSELVKHISKRCFVPLSVGGGISSIDQIHRLIHSGADKISLNSNAHSNPALIEEGARFFGSQSIIISVDAKKDPQLGYQTYTHGGTVPTQLTPLQMIERVSQYGAGEILLNSIDRDGSKEGYDIPMVHECVTSTTLPVIALGGAKNPDSMNQLLSIPNLSGIAASNYFHYSEHSVTIAKSYLHRHHPHAIRLESYADYSDFDFESDQRIAKKEDHELMKLLFEFHPKEVI